MALRGLGSIGFIDDICRDMAGRELQALAPSEAFPLVMATRRKESLAIGVGVSSFQVIDR